ncbi:isocitrate/isopropylmalate dehydrogenase family protein [Micromonospora echinofusca]|uniref:Isocitrate/isopropylmalate dehydrogenase family protein n=1 Tax=Micromonospora echinofusca TaxID=47858 RepID=A0ABS3VW08_MICEH|nr:isocitrate/isopropylmalate dehydrogenase family protein [Micromonospora echinofusca]MBO4208646.1 isocitrate/isopropylmalate dehydrogenase family protein [Micromonospora echinofusca]
MHTVRVAVIPGDGVGPEVVSATLPVLRAAAHRAGAEVDTVELDWGGEHYLRTGRAMPPDAVDVLRGFPAVLFGAVGRPDIPDHELIWGLIIGLRQALDLAVNVRPVRSWPGVRTVLREPDGIDLVIVRENTEGEYAGVGGRLHPGSPRELGVEVAVHSRAAIERATRYAFVLARSRRGRVSLVTKSNAMRYGYTLWDAVCAEVAREYPDVEWESVLVDAMAARLVQRPRDLDVLLCGNLFGDILSDLAAVLGGGMGMAPSANLRPDADVPALFEPVHGSAPDIAGLGIANPVACMLSGAMLLDHVGLPEAATAVRDAVAHALRDPSLHPADLGGTATTERFAAAVVAAV